MTTVSDGLYQYGGVPVGGMFTPGRAIFVRPGTGSDGNTGKSPSKAVKTLAKALSLATADKGDVVYMIAESNTAGNTTDYQTTALDWNKDGVHLIGMGCGPMIGQRSRIAQDAATLTIEDLFTVSADNCLIQNIEIFHGVNGSTATSPRAMVVSGQRNHIVNCQISGMGDATGANSMDTAGARSLAVTGAENTFSHCYIGLDTTLRATALAEVTVGDIARTIFEDCIFNTYTSLTTMKIVTYSAPDRFILFKNCLLNAVNNITSAVKPTGALAAATSVNGQIILQNSVVVGCDNVTTADDTKVFVSGPAGGLVDMGLASGVDIA